MNGEQTESFPFGFRYATVTPPLNESTATQVSTSTSYGDEHGSQPDSDSDPD